jgi:hypothetical protein
MVRRDWRSWRSRDFDARDDRMIYSEGTSPPPPPAVRSALPTLSVHSAARRIGPMR